MSYDEDGDSIYNYFRDYDPQTGRYLQPDPIGLGDPLGSAVSSNLYGYVEGYPIGSVDLLGLETAQITMHYPLPPPNNLSGSWGIGGCLGLFCIGLNEHMGMSIGTDGKLCLNFGAGIGSPVSWSTDVGQLQ